jgi:dihydroxyacetone kinase
VLAAIRAVGGKPGVLLIVKNYTGDRLNFGLAAEMARAEGLEIETVLVADDVALADTQAPGERRGLAGTVLVHKIAGAAATAGKTLSEVAALAREGAGNVATVGLSLSAGTIPAAGRQTYVLADHEIEFGLGIHGEPGAERAALQPADDLAKQLLDRLLSGYPLATGDRIAVLINNLGATTNMELAIFARKTLASLRDRGAIVERVYPGTFVTSLEAAGISLSLIRVDDALLQYLDAPTDAPAWPNLLPLPPGDPRERIIVKADAHSSQDEPTHALPNNRLQRAIQAACKALQNAEQELTELDSITGDGDLGASLSRGAKAVESGLTHYQLDRISDTLQEIGLHLQEAMGGTSGPLYGALFLRVARTMQDALMDADAWTQACFAACDAVRDLGGASAGDRTMLDALFPFAQEFANSIAQGESLTAAFRSAVIAAEQGAKATAQMLPRRGRASYLRERALGHPDPGAVAVSIWLRAAFESLFEEPRA